MFLVGFRAFHFFLRLDVEKVAWGSNITKQNLPLEVGKSKTKTLPQSRFMKPNTLIVYFHTRADTLNQTVWLCTSTPNRAHTLNQTLWLCASTPNKANTQNQILWLYTSTPNKTDKQNQTFDSKPERKSIYQIGSLNNSSKKWSIDHAKHVWRRPEKDSPKSNCGTNTRGLGLKESTWAAHLWSGNSYQEHWVIPGAQHEVS